MICRFFHGSFQITSCIHSERDTLHLSSATGLKVKEKSKSGYYTEKAVRIKRFYIL